jgi:hypothetical protein
MARNRIIYASQSVWCDGEVLYRVQSLGSTTTFTSEDIFELGHLDIIDIVDDVPAVAVTLNTNEFGDVKTLAVLSQVRAAKIAMDAAPTDANANLVVVSGSQLVETNTFLHGVALADFSITCGNLPGVSLWAPVQDECSLGTLADDIDQTMFMDEVYVNSIEFGYTTGANATENYGAETDQKLWLLNDGRFVNYESWTITSGTTYVDLSLPVANEIATLADGNIGFLRKDENGVPAASWYDAGTDTKINVQLKTGTTSDPDWYIYYDQGTYHRLFFPTGSKAPEGTDVIEVIYAADGYGTAAANKYMEILDTEDRPDTLGAVRQGQVEIYMIDPQNPGSYATTIQWRLTAATITADLTREALAELGHLGPYDRPLTLPIPITVTVDSTAGDLEAWAKLAGKLTDFDAATLDSINLADLINKEDMVLVIMVYAQTDEEAGGTGVNRTLATNSPLIGQEWWYNGSMGTYAAAGDTEYPQKTIIVEHLKMTDEAYTLDLGANATQTFGFRSTNDLFVVKGGIAIGNISGDFKVRRNG